VALTSQTLREYKKRLMQQKAVLERSALATVEQGRETAADDTADSADQAVLSYEREILFTRGTQTHGQLALVKSALARMHEGLYGECVECGTEIGAKRLQAVPWTPYCIACQEKMERGELEPADQAA
jgi:RNA polymerase-binding transcription factor